MRNGLSGRVLPAFLAVASVGLMLTAVAARVTSGATLTDQLEQDLLAVATAAAAILEATTPCDPPAAAALLERIMTDEPLSPTTLAIHDLSGTRLVPAGAAPATLTTDDINRVLGRGVASGTRTNGTAIAYGAARVSDGDTACFVVVASRPLGASLASARSVTIAAVMAALAATIAVGVFLQIVLRRLTIRIRRIEEIAGRYAHGDLDIQLRIDGPPEIEAVAHSLNTMAQELRTRIHAISRQRNELETILSSMLEGVIVLDSSRRILSMNRAAGELFRVDCAEAAGKTIVQHVRNADLDDMAEHALDADEPIEQELTVYRDTPIHLQVHATSFERGEGSSHRGVLLVISDITRLTQLQQMRKDFVANVSHELKTPITSIQGFVETLIDGAIDDPEQARRFLTIISTHTNRLNLIIEDLLSLSRLEQNRTRLTVEESDLEAIMRSTMEVCGPTATAKSVRVTIEYDGPRTARINQNLIEQALVNLIDNAIKYSQKQREVRVSVSNTGGVLRLSVADSGQGIPARDLPRIFERFYRTDRARSRALGGTGLGLAIVKHIARAHNGDVSVTSTLGEGSVFTLSLPQPTER